MIDFINEKQKELINKPIDEKYIKKIDGLSYVSHSIMTEQLNTIFGHAWSWEILDHGIEVSRTYGKKKYGAQMIISLNSLNLIMRGFSAG